MGQFGMFQPILPPLLSCFEKLSVVSFGGKSIDQQHDIDHFYM